MPIPPLSVGEDELTKAVDLSREGQARFRNMIVGECAGTRRLNLFQIRRRERLLSSESGILKLPRWANWEKARCRFLYAIYTFRAFNAKYCSSASKGRV
jgi:hypothetical protein